MIWMYIGGLIFSVLIGVVVGYIWGGRSMRSLEQRCDALRLREDTLSAQLQRTRELLEMHMEQNEKFERQRNQAWKLYQLAGVQAGAAQQWLMRELQDKLRLLNAYRKERGESMLGVDPALSGIVQEFGETHASGNQEMTS